MIKHQNARIVTLRLLALPSHRLGADAGPFAFACAAAAGKGGMKRGAHLLSFFSLRYDKKAAPCGAA